MSIMRGSRSSFKQAKKRIDRTSLINRTRSSFAPKGKEPNEEPELTSEEIEFLAELLNRARTGGLQ